jgi:SAM-dependent methyltransferase
VQDAIRRGSRTLIAALNHGDATCPPRSDTGPVWQSPSVPLPDGLSIMALEASFRSWSVNGEPAGHMDGYIGESIWRVLHTWGMVRDDIGRGLELGANPSFTTYLLDAHTRLELTLANYYGQRGKQTETLSFIPPGGEDRTEVTRPCLMFNIEEDDFPFDDSTFDVVLFCEILEHLLMDPMATLRQIHRVLKPGGVLALTTPNVSRLGNVLALVSGENVYGPYSGFGPYGRHNREYTRHEVPRLLTLAGFEVEYSFTADGHPTDDTWWPHYPGVARLVEFRRPDLGQYLFFRARATGEPPTKLPSFLYQSRPEGEVVPYV